MYISDKDIAARYSVTRFAVWKWARENPDFPQPYRLSGKCTRWRLAEIEEWESSRQSAA